MTVDASPPRASIRLGPFTHALLALFTLASALAINPYYYGAADNRVTIPFVKAFGHPGLYPGDTLIAQEPYYYTFLWNSLGWLHHALGIGLPALFFAVYLIGLYATFLATYRIALALFDNTAGAVLTLLLVAFSRLTLAGIPTVDQMLTTRLVAVPILLFALLQFLAGKLVRSFALLGLAYLVHPLTTHYMLAMLGVAALLGVRSYGWRRLATAAAAFVIVASPMLIWRLQHAPPSMHLFSADPAWLEAMRLRSSRHMFPFTWGYATLLHAIVTTALFVVTARGWQSGGHTVIRRAFWTAFALCAVGVVFSEIVPLGFAFVFQFLRSFVFLEYFVMIYLAHYFIVRTDRQSPITDLVVASLGGVWIGFECQSVLLPAIEFAVVAMAVAVHRYGWLDHGGARRFAMAAAALVCLAAGATYGVNRALGLGPMFSITGVAHPLRLDVERWARRQTDPRDGFIVPPDADGEFRVEGERTVYSDWVEGGLMNGNPAFGREWVRRMRMLGYPDFTTNNDYFCQLRESRLIEIAAEMDMPGRRFFLVWPCLTRPLTFPLRYRNAGFMVYEIPRERFAAR